MAEVVVPVVVDVVVVLRRVWAKVLIQEKTIPKISLIVAAMANKLVTEAVVDNEAGDNTNLSLRTLPRLNPRPKTTKRPRKKP